MIIKKEFVHNGLSLSYLEKDNGADSSIIFLHGLNNRKEYYLKVMDLIDTHNCFSLDFRGHGDSSTEGEFSLRSFSLDVLGFIKHLKLTSNVYIVSSSFSAWVLSSLEEQIEVQGIFFLDAGYYKPSLEYMGNNEFITLPIFNSFNEINKSVLSDLSGLENEGIYLEKFMKQYIYDRLTSIYKPITCKTKSYEFILNNSQFNSLLNDLNNKDDIIIKNDNLILVLASSKNYNINQFPIRHNELKKNEKLFKKVLVIPNSDHLLMLTSPNELKSIIMNNLSI